MPTTVQILHALVKPVERQEYWGWGINTLEIRPWVWKSSFCASASRFAFYNFCPQTAALGGLYGECWASSIPISMYRAVSATDSWYSHFCFAECNPHQSKLVSDREFCTGNRILLFCYCWVKKTPFLLVIPVIRNFLGWLGAIFIMSCLLLWFISKQAEIYKQSKVTSAVVKYKKTKLTKTFCFNTSKQILQVTECTHNHREIFNMEFWNSCPHSCLGERNVAACLSGNWHFLVSWSKMSTAVSVGSCSSWASEPWHRDRANRCQPGRQHLCTASASYKTSGGHGGGACPSSYSRHFFAVTASSCITNTEGKGRVVTVL